MSTGKITKRSVDGFAPTGKTEFLWDDELHGFGLRLTAAGAKSYVYQYRIGGREAAKRRYTIGKHGSPWTPASAREHAVRLAHLVGRGIDPAAAEAEHRRQAVDLRMDVYGARFLSLYVRSEWPKSYAFAEGALRLHVYPSLGARPLPSISRTEIVELFDGITSTALRRNVYAVVRRLFRWALARGDIERSPLEGMETPPSVPSRDRVLTDIETALIWKAAGDLGYPFGPMYRLLIATGQRREEVAALDWSELNRSSGMWTLPARRAKNGQTHIVPLSALAIEEIDALASTTHSGAGSNEGWPQRGYVFSTNGRTPASGYSRAKSRLDLAVGNLVRSQQIATENSGAEGPFPAWRIHDIRRTLATGMQRLGIRFEVTEALLNHVSGSRAGVAGIYQRHDWKEEKSAALEAWSTHLLTLLQPTERSNVFPLRSSTNR